MRPNVAWRDNRDEEDRPPGPPSDDHVTGPGAIPSGTRVVKLPTPEKDAHAPGSMATVIGSFKVDPPVPGFSRVKYMYCLEWDDMPRLPVFCADLRECSDDDGQSKTTPSGTSAGHSVCYEKGNECLLEALWRLYVSLRACRFPTSCYSTCSSQLTT